MLANHRSKTSRQPTWARPPGRPSHRRCNPFSPHLKRSPSRRDSDDSDDSVAAGPSGWTSPIDSGLDSCAKLVTSLFGNVRYVDTDRHPVAEPNGIQIGDQANLAGHDVWEQGDSRVNQRRSRHVVEQQQPAHGCSDRYHKRCHERYRFADRRFDRRGPFRRQPLETRWEVVLSASVQSTSIHTPNTDRHLPGRRRGLSGQYRGPDPPRGRRRSTSIVSAPFSRPTSPALASWGNSLAMQKKCGHKVPLIRLPALLSCSST